MRRHLAHSTASGRAVGRVRIEVGVEVLDRRRPPAGEAGHTTSDGFHARGPGVDGRGSSDDDISASAIGRRARLCL